MNVKKALKTKKKLIREQGEALNKVRSYNSIIDGATREYDVAASLQEAIAKMEEVVALKTKIHRANLKVYDKIFRLSELKSFVAQLRSIDTTQGQVTQGYRENVTVTKTAVINRAQLDELVKKYEAEIEEIQDQLDEHNSRQKVA